MGQMDGRVAIVTGAGHGIGKAVALELAREGAAVVVNDLGGNSKGQGSDANPASGTADEITAAGGRAVANHDDVSDTATGVALVKAAVEEFGELNAIVNTAGILRDRMIVSMEDDDWDAVIRVHLRGHFSVTRAACQYWRQASKAAGGPVDGRIVNFCSEAGIYGNAGQTNYAAAKAGIISFSTAVAREVARYGVTSNTIGPRARTRMVLESGAAGFLPEPIDGFDLWDPANVAPAVTFLASEAGGAYSGQLLVVGAGLVQLIDPYKINSEVRFEGSPPTPDDIGALLADARGSTAGPEDFPIPIAQ